MPAETPADVTRSPSSTKRASAWTSMLGSSSASSSQRCPVGGGRATGREVRRQRTSLDPVTGHTNSYDIKISDAQMLAIKLQFKPDKFHGEWNYTCKPATSKPPPRRRSYEAIPLPGRAVSLGGWNQRAPAGRGLVGVTPRDQPVERAVGRRGRPHRPRGGRAEPAGRRSSGPGGQRC